MASYYHSLQHHHFSSNSSQSSSSHNHHGGRSRRAPRLSASHNLYKQFRGVRSPRDMIESPIFTAARARFEAGRSFDLDDDLEFCPGLLTEDDIQSIHSSSTDGSLASGSPHSSPLQPQSQPSQQVTPSFSLSSASSNNYNSTNGLQPSSHSQQQMKIHQPSALRTRNAIPIVNPNTGMRLPSPPSSVSPAMMQQQQQQQHSYQRRW